MTTGPGNAPALVLLAHGARDPRWGEALEALRARLHERAPGVPVALAFLEHLSPDLSGALASLADAGCASVTVVPIFLGQGGHVRRDVPERITAARREFPAIEIHLARSAGEDAGVIDALATFCLAEALSLRG